MAAWTATGKKPPELERPAIDVPSSLIDTFLELRLAQGSSGFGPNPITHLALDAWQRITRVRLSPWEADTLMAMDREAMTMNKVKP